MPGENYVEVPCIEGTSILEIINIKGKASLVIDKQRNYHRSFAGNLVLPGELITRLYVPDK